MSEADNKPTAVDKALILLDLVAQLSQQGRVRIVDLVNSSGFQRPTVHRLMSTLKSHGLVTQDEQGFQLGGKVLSLAAQAYNTMDIRRLAKPIMMQFSELTGLTIHLAILDGNEVVYIDKIESRHPIVLASGIGWRGKMHCTALGKAMMAFAERDNQRLSLQEPMEAKTEHSITSAEDLRAAWQEIKKQGYAIDDRENEVEIRCVASAILDHNGRPLAGISISGTTSQASMEDAQSNGQELAQACLALSRELGYRPKPIF
ncbi:IclR family transcriptional regulator [uncultured Pseudoteredinibacter sp.]|uniref:IclR family transcriptional regulator n=1 Tax=uncultured Pseudoteredinibacter sp. TaxID=1641701 RepID=UPI0026123ED1|nr:IclR family transcriptional regulator [uncultured Pseudoteredinibacter sp.]